MRGQLDCLGLVDRYTQLGESGDRLETLATTVDFEPFRYRPVKSLKPSDRSKRGRSPYDPVVVFEVLNLKGF